MGTSSSHPGSNDRSPLVPPHADAEPDKPLPKPVPQRFRQFRTNLGRYVKSGDRNELNKSLNSYAGQATGGPHVGPRRYGSAIGASGIILSTLDALRSGDSPSDVEDLDEDKSNKIVEAVGKPIDVAIEVLADNLAPEGEDNDKIREAIVYALSESLQDHEDDFNPEILTDELYVQTIVIFLSEVVFQDIVMESGDSFEKITSPEILEEREEEMREIITAAIDKNIYQHIKEDLTKLSREELKNIQLTALREVFAEWDNLEE